MTNQKNTTDNAFTLVSTILGGTFFGGILLSLGIALGNKITGLPLLTSSVNMVTTNQVNLFTAQGEAQLTVVPDQAEINLGVNITADSVKAAQDQANAISNNLQAVLATLGIDAAKIKTQDYSVYPEYDWSGDTRRIVGYNVNTSIRVTVTDFALLNSIIDAAANDGINEIGNIRFTLSSDKQNELRQQARQEAIKQAENNAAELARLSGLRLGKVVNVTENTDRTTNNLYTTNMKMATFDAAAQEESLGTNIEAGETTYHYYVTLSYQTL